MKTILIIYPHWHPTNLAGVHRPRLIGNFLPEHGWHPVVLTVNEQYFEEKPDYDFEKTFCDHYEVYRVNAFKVGKLRLVGDIGLRAFFHLYKEANRIIKNKEIDFIWIPVPSYYPALIGRLLHSKYKIPYGIDYIDPWVRDISNYPSSGLRQRLALAVARVLEPIAVKKADLISGVAKAYYASVLERNDTEKRKKDVAMPYGFDPKDHEIELEFETPWKKDGDVRPFIYAGAFLPNSISFFHIFFRSIKVLQDEKLWDENIKLHFIGTGNYPGITIQEIANNYGLQDTVVENRERYPFLNILYFLGQAEGVMAIGSPSPHYTASKIFQSILSKKPVFAFFHEKSTVVEILREANANQYLMTFIEGENEDEMEVRLKVVIQSYFSRDKDWNPDLKNLEKYSAKQSAKVLVEAINKCLPPKNA
ncbi:MAG: hypothetical protein R3277_08835 [Brumimicrobium sp.]|nr:hypothetical protein [Brumimicrobium sp.]